jgi:putative glutamine amidotransferase
MRDGATADPDPGRENVDELLLQDAHNLHKPILGICFGMQILNTWRGGTLIQDLRSEPLDHAIGPEILRAHEVEVSGKSLLSTCLFPDEVRRTAAATNISVNSSHHQAVGVAGDNLRVSARSLRDGIIEAIESTHALGEASPHFVLGVQWHPERTFLTDLASRALFERFVAEASAWIPRSVSVSVA